MKTKLTLIKRAVLLALFSTINCPLSTLYTQGTAFTYQGQLQNNGSPASGDYNLTFSLFNTNTTGVPIAGPVTNNAVFVTNGLFTVLIDFGPGVFTGTNYWLDIGVETNGAGSFTTLTPRQQLTPTPYAIYAESVAATGVTGTLLDTQLVHDAVTISAGPGLSGGGKVALGNTITLTNTGVLSVTGNADITAATVGGAVTLGDTGTSADTASTLVKRDGSGNFSAASISLDGNLNLPATTPTAGIIYSGGVTMIHAHGSQNFFAGPSAGNLTMSGINSTANGYHALFSNTTGSDDTAMGTAALLLNTSGSDNTANGTFALFNNTSGSSNTVSGSQAMFSNTTGSNNTASGDLALYSNTNGAANTANGYQALYWNTGDNLGDGSYNTASGYQALYNNTIGDFNTANGSLALYSNTNGYANTASGGYALYSNTSGINNTANGVSALGDNTTGSLNTANGAQALFSNTLGSNNTASGYEALYANTGDTNEGGFLNTATGVQALYSNTLGSANTANGYQALYSNQGDDAGDGFYNTANGAQALYSNTSGSENTANGVQALYSNTNGSGNTANGYTSLYFNANGDNNTADGFDALGNSVGGGNTAVGSDAFFAAQDAGIAMNNNTAIGASSLFSLGKGDNNTALGWHALYGVTNGTQNIAVGYRAGQSVTNGSSNIEIGNLGTAPDNATIRIGTTGAQTNTFIAGISGVTISPAGAAVFINSAGELGTINSSKRFKEDIQNMGDESDVILALRPVAFRYKHELDPLGTQQFGLIAEEVEKVAPELVLRDDRGEIYTVRYEQINAMLPNEFLKQHHAVEAQNGEIQKLKQQNDSLEQRLTELEKTIARVTEKSDTTFVLNSEATENK